MASPTAHGEWTVKSAAQSYHAICSSSSIQLPFYTVRRWSGICGRHSGTVWQRWERCSTNIHIIECKHARECTDMSSNPSTIWPQLRRLCSDKIRRQTVTWLSSQFLMWPERSYMLLSSAYKGRTKGWGNSHHTCSPFCSMWKLKGEPWDCLSNIKDGIGLT